jgi:hypothetical protein
VGWTFSFGNRRNFLDVISSEAMNQTAGEGEKGNN